ncbi:MAG: ATP-grasp fold amidoligase family protein [Anderseniella sp.]
MDSLSRFSLAIVLNLYAWLRYPHLLFRYWRTLKQFPDAAFPRSFNEKLLWRKIFDRDPRFGPMTDKLAARDIAKARAPELKTPEVVWAGDAPEDLPPDVLAGPCVIKTNRGSGWNLFNWSANQFSKADVVDYFRPRMRFVYGRRIGEWTYAMVRQKFYAEELFTESSGRVPDDFNIHTFGGRVLTISMIHDRFGNRNHISLNRDLSRADTVWEEYSSDYEPQFEDIHHKMADIAERLAEAIDYVRVDLFCHDGRIYFREFTFFPGSGLSIRNVGEIELMRNAWWDLSRSSYLADAETGWKRTYRRLLGRDLATAEEDLKRYRTRS